MYQTVQIIRPGTRVRFVHADDGPATAVVISAAVYDQGQTNYDVAWFADGVRESGWVGSFEIEPVEDE